LQHAFTEGRSLNLHGFLSELKRRRVVRVAAVYAVAAWLVIQIAETTFPHLALPSWSVTLVIVLALLGFPIALVLAWAFDITPEGVVRTEPVPERVRRQPRAGQIAVAGAVAVLALAGGAFTIFGGVPEDDHRSDLEQSIAVLPFANMSADAENEYFSDGVQEDVIATLSRIAELRVISRTSTLGYKGTTRNLREIGEELGVATILAGSVRRDGSSVRVTAQLVDARTDQNLWSETYDRQLTSIFQIQSEIAQQIAAALRVRLASGERERLHSQPTSNLTAYDEYLRGRHHARSTNRSDTEAAITFFKRALDLDPAYALAYAGLGRAYMARSGYLEGAWKDSAVVMVDRAASLAPRDGEVLAAQGIVYQNFGRVRESLAILRRAAEFAPNSALVMGGLAASTSFVGDGDEALRWALRSAALEPTTALFPRQVGGIYGGLGMPDESDRWYQTAIRLQPDFLWAYSTYARELLSRGDLAGAERELQIMRSLAPADRLTLADAGTVHLMRGEYEQARASLAAAVSASGTRTYAPTTELGFALARLGRSAEARELLDISAEDNLQLLRDGPESAFPRYRLVRIRAVQGNRDEAIRWLEEAFEYGWRDSRWARRDPLLENLRADARFERILADVDARVAEMRRRVEREGLR
jgi:adenylate cyclase